MWEHEHAARCEALLGKPWHQVHHWLDQLAHPDRLVGGKTFNPHHRKHRHNREGIEQIRAWYGDDAARAAELHILDDCFGPHEHTDKQRDQIPVDESDYVFRGVDVTCCICHGPAHPATGAQYSPTALACFDCVVRLWSDLRRKMRGKPRGGKGPSFYDHAAPVGGYPRR